MRTRLMRLGVCLAAIISCKGSTGDAVTAAAAQRNIAQSNAPQSDSDPASGGATTTPEALPPRIGPIKGDGMFAHAVCALRLADSKDSEQYVFEEGDVCPVGGGDCVYHGLINLAGKDVLLRRASDSAGISVYGAEGVEVSVQYIVPSCGDGEDCETVSVTAKMAVTVGRNTASFALAGECGA